MLDNRPIVDSREPEKIRQALLQVGWLQKPLACGDFSFLSQDGLKIGITRKTADDLLNSIGETFAKQLDEMLDYYDICFLLREGTFHHNPATDTVNNTRYTYSAVENWLIRFYNKGFSPILTTNWKHTVRRLPKLYALYQKPYSMSARSRKWADERILALPAGLRGATGERVLEHFGSLRGVATAVRISPSFAPIKELEITKYTEISRVGRKKAELLWEHFNKIKIRKEKT